MNILYRACASKNGYQSTILNKLYEKNCFKKCVVITQNLDDKDVYDSDIYLEIDAIIGYSCSYNEMCNMDVCPEVPEKVLSGLKQYEPYALNMSCRNYHMHIMYYDEIFDEYMLHVKFWNNIIDENNIDFIFLSTTPHCMWEYVIYSLGKVKNIPILIETEANVPGFNEVGTSITNFGNNTKVCYEEKKYDNMCKYVSSYYYSILNRSDSCDANKKRDRFNSQKRWVRNLYYIPLFKKALTPSNLINLYTKHDKSSDDYQKSCLNIQALKRFIKKKRRYGNQTFYNKKICAKAIDFNEKYVFFALQYFPESSVLPRAGVFWNQLNSIRMLAHAASKLNMKVFVKEHWLEEGRPRKYYYDLKRIKGVTCVSCDVDSYKLIENACAVSSATGSCMQEALIKGKPIITFADHCLCGAPGVFRVHDEIDIQNALITITKKDFCINEIETKNYFSALSRTLVKGYLDWPQNDHISFDECIDDTVDLIFDFINTGLKEDYVYIKKCI